MIPQKIHYCWFGGKPLPDLAVKCITSWKKYLPDYEVIEWNESNFDINMCSYTKEAYESKKYAFVSDYARFWILYNHGGIYFDTDVELIKPINSIVNIGGFFACEQNNSDSTSLFPLVNPGLGIASIAKHPLYKQILDKYSILHFIKSDGELDLTTVVTIITEVLVKNGLQPTQSIQKVDDITIYPPEYFCPKNYNTGKIVLTDNSVAIHHYGESWQPWDHKLEMQIWRLFGVENHPLITWHIRHWLSKISKRFK